MREEGRKEGNVSFNDALNTLYLWLIYGIGLMVKDHSDSERVNPLPPHMLLPQSYILLLNSNEGVMTLLNGKIDQSGKI